MKHTVVWQCTKNVLVHVSQPGWSGTLEYLEVDLRVRPNLEFAQNLGVFFVKRIDNKLQV